ncbi:MAG: hypothetical protein EOP84_04565 [Verrucomicrobiaceae bacterium]|nr:MAG: hypothetical protein EOP84_04565 [Verrucomicrobiaceae bacterium]
MTAASPVEQVVSYLTALGHHLLPEPLVISGLKFAFPAVLSGPERSSDLVIVLDTAVETPNEALVRQVLAVARALDVARQKNPITTIVVGPRPERDHIAEMMSISRVLALGPLPVVAADAEKVLENWLAVLTPLPEIDFDERGADPLEELRARINDIREDVQSVLEEAEGGARAVTRKMNWLIERDLAPLQETEE